MAETNNIGIICSRPSWRFGSWFTWKMAYHPAILMFTHGYPLVNLYITNWKDPPCYLAGQHPLFRLGHGFNSYVTRGYMIHDDSMDLVPTVPQKSAPWPWPWPWRSHSKSCWAPKILRRQQRTVPCKETGDLGDCWNRSFFEPWWDWWAKLKRWIMGDCWMVTVGEWLRLVAVVGCFPDGGLWILRMFWTIRGGK